MEIASRTAKAAKNIVRPVGSTKFKMRAFVAHAQTAHFWFTLNEYRPNVDLTAFIELGGRYYIVLRSHRDTITALYRITNRQLLKRIKAFKWDDVIDACRIHDNLIKLAPDEEEAEFVEDGGTPTPDPDFISEEEDANPPDVYRDTESVQPAKVR